MTAASGGGEHELDLGRGDVLRKHAADAAALMMDLEHALRRGLEIAVEIFLQHHHDELHRRVVVVEQDHLVHPRRLGLLGLALDDNRTLAVIRAGWPGDWRSRRWRLIGGHKFILSTWRSHAVCRSILASGRSSQGKARSC